ncbi:hypothetical protein Tco_0554712 [Tanacetum coccineum]
MMSDRLAVSLVSDDMGVLIGLESSRPNFLSISLMYLDWLKKMPSSSCLICKPRKKFTCNPKEYDGKGGAIVYTRWMRRSSQFRIRVGVGMSGEGFKTFTREEFYPSNDMQKLEIELWNHAMGEAGHAAYTDRFHELARLFPHLVTPKNKRIERYIYGLSLHIRGMVAATKPSTIQKAVQIASILTNESLRNGSIKKNPEKIGNGGEPSKDRNGREDNKRTRTGNAFATTTNPVKRENTVIME